MTFSQSVTLLFSLFIICSPFVAVPVMINLTRGHSEPEKKRVAMKATLAIAIVLVVFCWLGTHIFSLFGIRLASLQIGGGFVVFLLGLSTLGPIKEKTTEAGECIAVVPLAIPLMAGPGAISQVILAAEAFSGIVNHLVITGVLLVLSFLLGMCLFFCTFLERVLGKKGLNVLSNLGGLILISIAVETMIKGVIGFFPAIG